MRAISLVLALAITLPLSAQPVFQWARTVPNVSTPGQLAFMNDLDVAPDGSAYTTGWVNGPRAIVGDRILDKSFVARYQQDGTLLWAASPGGTALTANGNNGVFVVGSFSGTMQFGGSTLTAADVDAFVAKYDASGQQLWARKMGGALNDAAYSVAVDGLGRVHVGGFFRGTGTFGSSTLVATHDSTGFHATYDANGNFQWAVLAGGLNDNADYNSILNAITCDAAGNTFMAGVFDATGTFGATALAASEFSDIYLAKFDANGNCTWVHRMGCEDGNYMRGIGLTPAGNLFLYGGFVGTTATFGTTTLVNNNFGHRDIFLAHFDGSGNAQWAQTVGGSFFNDTPTSLEVDGTGHGWVSGNISATALFGTLTLNGYGTFLAQYDESGTAISVQRPTTAHIEDHAMGILGDHYMCGHYYTEEFDTGSGVNISAALWQGQGGYLARYDAGLDFQWLQGMGLHATAFDGAVSVVTDPSGNVYSAGYFNTTAILCSDTLRAPLGAVHMWLNKRDANGNCLWTRQFLCSQQTEPNAVSAPTALVMNASGELYLTGRLFGSVDFGTAQLVSAGGEDIFLAKFDASGTCVWAIGEGGSGEDSGASLSVDANGNILLPGWYSGSATIGGNLLGSLGYADGFLAKYAPDGSALWVKSFGGAGWDVGSGADVDPQGNCYVTGRFSTSASFDGYTVTGSGDADLYLAKYDANGDLQWLTGSTGPGSKHATAVVVGASGQVYITGQYSGSLTVCTNTLVGDPANDHAFFSCFNPSGALLWQQEFPAATSIGTAIAARPAGDIVLAGGFYGSMTMGTTTLTATGAQDAWVAAFNSAGDNLWAQAMAGGDPFDLATVSDVTADALNVHVVGSFGDFYFTAFDQTGGTIAFAPGDPGSVRFAPNCLDGFVVKYASQENISPPVNPVGCDGTVAVEERTAPGPVLVIAPNPVHHSFTITSSIPIDPQARVLVHDATGRAVELPIVVRGAVLEVDASALTAGAYSVMIPLAKGHAVGRFLKQ